MSVRRLAEYGDIHGGEVLMAPCAVRFSDRALGGFDAAVDDLLAV